MADLRGNVARASVLSPELAAAAEEVVAQAEVHEHREDRQPDDRVADVDGLAERLASHLLDEGHHDVAAVQWEHRQEVQQAEGEADEAEHEQEVACSLPPRLR